MHLRNIVFIALLLLVILIAGFKFGVDYVYRSVPNRNFTTGETLTYRIHYGLINAAEAVMHVNDKYHYVNGRPCYKIDVYGNTTGLFDIMYRVRDNWGAYVDTAALVPHRAYRNIEEGRYRKYEVVNFEHPKDLATVINLDKKTKKPEKKGQFPIPDEVFDMVSGYYYLRTVNFRNLKKNDVVTLKGFYVDDVYEIDIKFLGREQIKTKVGDINALIIAPILPENDLFEGANPVKAWISDDLNKVPLKVEANLKVGALEIDIKEMKNLRN